MTDRFEGQVVLITGGGSGIGAAAARRFVAEGARVVVADIAAPAAERIAAELGDAGRAAVGDIADPEAAAGAVAAAVDAFGRLDVVVNNAATGAAGRLAELSVEDWRRTLDINLTGHFLVTRAALPVMLERRRGVFVNMSTAAAVMVEEGLGAYACAKAGVMALTRQVAVEYGRRGIRANAICPGSVATPPTLAFIAAIPGVRAKMEAANPMRRIADPDELARAVLFLASDDASYVNGTALMVDAGATVDNSVGLLPEG